jgi:hypothetical protein
MIPPMMLYDLDFSAVRVAWIFAQVCWVFSEIGYSVW